MTSGDVTLKESVVLDDSNDNSSSRSSNRSNNHSVMLKSDGTNSESTATATTATVEGSPVSAKTPHSLHHDDDDDENNEEVESEKNKDFSVALQDEINRTNEATTIDNTSNTSNTSSATNNTNSHVSSLTMDYSGKTQLSFLASTASDVSLVAAQLQADQDEKRSKRDEIRKRLREKEKHLSQLMASPAASHTSNGYVSHLTNNSNSHASAYSKSNRRHHASKHHHRNGDSFPSSPNLIIQTEGKEEADRREAVRVLSQAALSMKEKLKRQREENSTLQKELQSRHSELEAKEEERVKLIHQVQSLQKEQSTLLTQMKALQLALDSACSIPSEAPPPADNATRADASSPTTKERDLQNQLTAAYEEVVWTQKDSMSKAEQIEYFEYQLLAKNHEIDNLKQDLNAKLKKIVELEVDLEIHNDRYLSYVTGGAAAGGSVVGGFGSDEAASHHLPWNEAPSGHHNNKDLYVVSNTNAVRKSKKSLGRIWGNLRFRSGSSHGRNRSSTSAMSATNPTTNGSGALDPHSTGSGSVSLRSTITGDGTLEDNIGAAGGASGSLLGGGSIKSTVSGAASTATATNRSAAERMYLDLTHLEARYKKDKYVSRMQIEQLKQENNDYLIKILSLEKSLQRHQERAEEHSTSRDQDDHLLQGSGSTPAPMEQAPKKQDTVENGMIKQVGGSRRTSKGEIADVDPDNIIDTPETQRQRHRRDNNQNHHHGVDSSSLPTKARFLEEKIQSMENERILHTRTIADLQKKVRELEDASQKQAMEDKLTLERLELEHQAQTVRVASLQNELQNVIALKNSSSNLSPSLTPTTSSSTSSSATSANPAQHQQQQQAAKNGMIHVNAAAELENKLRDNHAHVVRLTRDNLVKDKKIEGLRNEIIELRLLRMQYEKAAAAAGKAPKTTISSPLESITEDTSSRDQSPTMSTSTSFDLSHQQDNASVGLPQQEQFAIVDQNKTI